MSATIRDNSGSISRHGRTNGASPSSRLKYAVFLLIGLMMAYVLWHFERFLIDPTHPVWQHYEPFKWLLLPHGVAGACALFLAPLQFSNRLRRRFLPLHKIIGSIFVIAVFILGPVGIYIQYMDEGQGAARSFTWETVIQAGLLMTTTAIGLYFALQRRITQHRQWMIRGYAVALSFVEVRVILGLTGLDQPLDWHVIETIVWTCTAMALLVADIANQVYERRSGRAAPA